MRGDDASYYLAYWHYAQRPTETTFSGFGRSRKWAETEYSVTAVTETRPKLQVRSVSAP